MNGNEARTNGRPAANERLKTLVEAESISNDGVAVVLYAIALAAVQGNSVSWSTAVVHGLVQIPGGIGVGAACAVPIWLILRMTRSSEYEVTATVVLAYVAYLLADSHDLSGIFATASAAVVLRAGLTRLGQSPMQNRNTVDDFWNSGAYTCGCARSRVPSGIADNAPAARAEASR